MQQQYQVSTPKEFSELITDCLNWYKDQSLETLVVTLKGDLGAGKTTFVQEFGKTLGVEEVITSPTFTIMKQYPLEHDLFDSLVHIDVYRFESEDEAVPLQLESVLQQPKTIVFIEWPERISSLVSKTNISIDISISENNSRTVSVTTK